MVKPQSDFHYEKCLISIRIAAIKLLYFCLRPWIIILLILDFEIAKLGYNLEISQHIIFTSVKYWLIVISLWTIDKSSLSKNYSLASFFCKKSEVNVSHSFFGISIVLIYSKFILSIVILTVNMPYVPWYSISLKQQHP